MRKKGFGFFSFIRTPGHQIFEYVPRYYSPEKEELEMRIKNIEQEFDDDAKKIANTKANIRYKYKQLRTVEPKAGIRTNIRFLVILALLTSLAWWVFFS